MKRFNVVTKKVYTKNGEEKAQWNTIGQLIYFPSSETKEESYALELSMFPTTKFYVFEQKPREQGSGGNVVSPGYNQPVNNSSDEINPDDIPF